jgi:type I restriction enzyme S subunit
MKEGWEEKKLRDISNIGAGNPAPQDKKSFDGGNIPFFRTSDIGQIKIGEIFESKDYINSDERKNFKLYPAGTIVLPKSGASSFLNHRVILGVEGYVSSHLATLVINNHKVNNKFIFYKLCTIKAQDLLQDIAYPSLNIPIIENITIEIPPLSEQHRIVSILDTAFEALTQAKIETEKNLLRANELFQSELNRVFEEKREGWEEKKLGDVCQLDRKQGFYSNLPYLGMEDIESDTAKFSSTDTIKVIKSSTFLFNNQHILYGRLRPYLKKVLCPDFTGHCSTEILPIKPSKHLNRKYLLYWFLWDKISTRINGTCTGCRMPRANMEAVFQFNFYLPPLQEQHRIVVFLDELSSISHKLNEYYTTKLTLFNELKQSLLHQAFNGNL